MKRTYLVVAIALLAAMVLALVPACDTATPTATAKPAAPTAAAATPTKAAAAVTVVPTAATVAPTKVPGVSTGVTDKEIIIGGTYPLTGPLSAYATISKGIEAYFKYVNATKGGVNGRQLTWKILDDAYSPAKTVQAAKTLVEDDKVFMLFNTFGTAPALGIREYMNAQKVPQLFVFSGAATFGNEYKQYPWSMGWAPNYEDEAINYAKYILQVQPNAKIGVLYQNDDMGKDYLAGLTKGLGDKAATMIVSKQPYETASADAASQLQNIKAAGADVIFWAASSKWVAQGLKSNFGIGYTPLNIVNVNAAQAAIMEQAGLDAAQGVISSAFIKDPTDATWKADAGMIQYTDIMNKYYPGGAKAEDIASLSPFSGMALGWNLEKVLLQAGKDLTREGLMNAAANMNYADSPFVIPGIVIKTDVAKGDWRPIDSEQLMKFDKATKSFVRFGNIMTAAP